VGGVDTIEVDVRFIAATHRPLEQMVERGEFREDLFYRPNVIPLDVPPLRERRSDIELLARHFGEALARAHHVPALTIEPGAVELLAAAPWPGNVRQLAN
jgi:DNA-binding NtrC family response regulator